ncbi:hypothetical protein niasHS_008647 [Heterodera schachtii]|uniref:Uncharacterized protein n=1 Tax=Heterodera schachtii TaxID=97005 RepID=A0ABD2J9P3_HETSC
MAFQMLERQSLNLFSLLLFLVSIMRIYCRNANVVTPSAAVPLFLVDGEVKSLNKNSTPKSSAAAAGEMQIFAENMGGRRLIGGDGADGGQHRWKSEGRTGHLRTLLWHLTNNDHHDQHQQQVPMDDNFSATDEEDIRRMIYSESTDGREKNSNETMGKKFQRYKNAKETTATKNGTTVINDKTTFFFINSIKFKQQHRHTEQNTQKMKTQNQGFEKIMKTKQFQHPSSKNGEKLRNLNRPSNSTKKKPTTVRTMAQTTVATTTTAQVNVGTTAQTNAVTSRPTTVVPPLETVAQTTVVTTRPTTVVPPSPQKIGKFRQQQQQQVVNADTDNRGPPAIAPQSPGTSTAQQLSDGGGAKQLPEAENRRPKQKGRQPKMKAKKPKKNANKIGKKLLLRRIFKTGPHGISRENLNSSSSTNIISNNNNNNNTNATKMEPKLRNGITVPLDNSKNERWNSGGTINANTAPCNAQAMGGCQLASAQPAGDTNCACRANEGNRCGTFGADECFSSPSAAEEIIGGGGSDSQAFVASGIGCHQLDQSECDQ